MFPQDSSELASARIGSARHPAPLVLFTEADTLYADMRAAIAGAQDRVWMETYTFGADSIGWAFAQALAERAAAGVDVRLRVDTAGALESPTSRRIRRYLRQAGVALRWFNRFRRLLPSRLNHRDHRKLLVVDERWLYVGSSNIFYSNSRRLLGDDRRQQYDVRIDGTLHPQAMAFAAALWEDPDMAESDWRPVAAGKSQLVSSSPHNRQRPLRSLYRALFEQAQSSAWLLVGYFAPDEDTVHTIEQAALRGVDVRLILPRHTDRPPTRWAAHAYYQRLLDANVRIHEYLPSILHAKAAVADREWAILGSGNFDFRSFCLNYELNLESRDAALCCQLHRAMLDDLTQCEEITTPAWSRRPSRARFEERLVWPLRRHL